MCIEREKDNFKSREVNCLKECALALNISRYLVNLYLVFLGAYPLAIIENQNIEFRAVIKFLTKEGTNAKEIHKRMTGVYGDRSPACSTATKWSGEFKREHSSLQNDPQSGRPADVITKEIMASVKSLIMNDRRIKIDDKAGEYKISNGSISTIIHAHLGMSKASARWVPQNLNVQDRFQRL